VREVLGRVRASLPCLPAGPDGWPPVRIGDLLGLALAHLLHTHTHQPTSEEEPTMSTTDSTTTPMPDFLPLDSPTAKLEAVAAVLFELDADVEHARYLASERIESAGVAIGDAWELAHADHPTIEAVVYAIYAELDRRKGTPLPGLEA
jgi:hypothetical protein